MGRATLLIAKLNCLACNSRSLLGVVEDSEKGSMVFCDLPTVPHSPIGKFLVTQMAAVAELQAGIISQRKRAALAAAKANGVVLGNPQLRADTPDAAPAAAAVRAEASRARAADVLPYVEEARRAACKTLRDVAAALTDRGVPAPAGGRSWHPMQVKQVFEGTSPAVANG